MKTRQELKQLAKEQMKGNIPILFGCCLIAIIFSAIINKIPYATVSLLGTILITPVISFNLTAIFLHLTHGQKPELGDMFKNTELWGKVIILNLLMTIFLVLWSLLFIIPGIIKGYSYSMSYYILLENPEMSAREAITASRQMMDGHKLECFILSLSFILWILLCTVTLGIALIYVMPYMQTTLANFYNNIKPVETHHGYTYDSNFDNAFDSAANPNPNYYA